jgi:hypothetical protein
MPVHNVAKAQECPAKVCDISTGIVQRIISEGNVTICISLSLCVPPTFVPVSHFNLLLLLKCSSQSLDTQYSYAGCCLTKIAVLKCEKMGRYILRLHKK